MWAYMKFYCSYAPEYKSFVVENGEMGVGDLR